NDAAGALLLDDDSHRASLDTLAEREPAAAGESSVRESLQHVAIILHRGRQRFFTATGMFVALRAATTDGLQEDAAVFITANYGDTFVPSRNPVIALEVPWRWQGESR